VYARNAEYSLYDNMCMLHSYDHNARKIHYVKVPNELFKQMHVSRNCDISNKLKLYLREN